MEINMIGTCSRCGNHEWDKEVNNNIIKCPKCGNEWYFKRVPIFFLTGCSGVGKTTTGIELQKLTDDFVILDVDWLRNIAWPQNDDEEDDLIEQIYSLSKNISQSGKSVVWTMAGGIDRLMNKYGVRFFSSVKVLALTADSDIIRDRMTNGRGITDEEWIKSSIDYNEYFRTHDSLGDTGFKCMDCGNQTPAYVAGRLLEWLIKEKQ